MYNEKYAITARCHVAPTFNEIRHILNLGQLMAIGTDLKFISFDGDQTLYSDGGNFAENSGLSYQIIELIKAGIIVCVVTAANYQHNGEKYEVRLEGLLRRFVKSGLQPDEIERFISWEESATTFCSASWWRKLPSQIPTGSRREPESCRCRTRYGKQSI